MNKIEVKIITPTGTHLDSEAQSLTVPTANGYITILPGHVPLVASLKPGEMVVRAPGKEIQIHVAGGFLYIKKDNEVTVLADEAEHSKDLNEALILESQARAQELLKQTNMSDEEYAKVAASLELNLSKLRTVRRHKHHTRHPITSEGVLKE